MTTLKQSTARNISLKLFLSSDHLTGATGKTLTVTLSKNGAAFGAAGATVTERTSGWYQIALTTTDTNTLGDLVIRATAAACDDAERLVEVVSYDPQSATNLGLSNLDAASSSLATQTSVNTIDDFLDTEIAAIKAKTDNLPASPAAVGSAMTLATDALNAAALAADAVTEIQSGLATQTSVNTIDDFLDTEIAAIKAKTDNLPASPAAVGSAMTLATDALNAAALAADAVTEIQSGLATAAALNTVDDFLDTEIAAIKAKTDNLPAAPAATGDIPSAATVAAAVWAVVMEGAFTAKDYMRLMASSLFAKLSGAATTTVTIRDTADSKARVTATVDADGNRTAVTLDPS